MPFARLTNAAAFALPLAVMTVPSAAYAQAGAGENAAEAAPFDADAAWTEFETLLRNFYAYVERADIDVDAQLTRSKTLALQSSSADEFRSILRHTVAAFVDPHLIVQPFAADDFVIVMGSADMDMQFDNGRAIVVDVRRASPAFDAGIRPGDEIVSIGGVDASLAARVPFGEVLPDPNPVQLNYGLTMAANGKIGSDRMLEVRSGAGPVRQIELISGAVFARSLSDRPLATVNFIGANADVAHIRVLDSLGNNDLITQFDEIMTQAQNADAVILDLRETPSGGNTEVGRSIIGHFVDEVRPYQMHRIPSLEREFTVPREFVENVYPRGPHFDGPVFVLHGRWTGSMGEGVVIGMDAASDAITIGSNMSDLLGGVRNTNLTQSATRFTYGNESLFHVDGTPREDFVADIPISPIDTAPDGSDPGIAAVLGALGKRP